MLRQTQGFWWLGLAERQDGTYQAVPQWWPRRADPLTAAERGLWSGGKMPAGVLLAQPAFNLGKVTQK